MQRCTKFSYLYQGLLPILLGVLAVGGLLVGAQTASAGTVTGSDVCLATLSGLSRPNCTAGDIRLAQITNPADVVPSECTAGETFDLTATFTIATTASERYDIGIYFDILGDEEGDGARTGTCSLSTLPTSPTPPYLNLDGDFCGDTRQGTVRVTITIPNVLCEDTDEDGFLNLPYCTSWAQNAQGVCATERNATPGTTSKCNCDNAFEVPVRVTAGDITATKSATPAEFPESASGTSVTFEVVVTNIGDANVTLSTIVDDPDNNLATTDSITYTTILTGDTCPAGQQCASCDTLTVTPAGDASCTFIRTVTGGPGTQTDRACANGTDTSGNVLQACATAEVTIGNVNPTADVSKTPLGTLCATVRYGVTVTNTDPAESITLDSLCDDKFGTIAGAGCPAGTEGIVQATTCTVPQTLQISGTGSAYSCTFDAEVCTAGHVDTVTATVSDNETPPNSTTAQGSATVNAPPAFLP